VALLQKLHVEFNHSCHTMTVHNPCSEENEAIRQNKGNAELTAVKTMKASKLLFAVTPVPINQKDPKRRVQRGNKLATQKRNQNHNHQKRNQREEEEE
jgi:hypothetical protein